MAEVPPFLAVFAKAALAQYDVSHDYNHSLRVWKNVQVLPEFQVLTERDREIVMVACIVHDIVDHKYKNAITAEDLRAFLADRYGSFATEQVMHIITNISWSKRQHNMPLPYNDDLRKIVQDADWWDALGLTGIERCSYFTSTRQPNLTTLQHTKEMLKHMEEKLLKIIDSFNFESTKTLARLDHEAVKYWYDEHLSYLKELNLAN